MRRGIDVSKWQGNIDWGKVRADGIECVMIKFGNQTEKKGTVIDERFAENLRGATAAGLSIGLYIYQYAQTVESAAEGAENLVAAISSNRDAIRLPIAIDMEDSEYGLDKLPREHLTAMVDAFGKVIRRAGFIPALYTNPNWLKNYIDRPDGVRLWLAHYASAPAYDADIWQHSDKGRVNGIPGSVDLDWVYMDDVGYTVQTPVGDSVPAAWSADAVDWCQRVGILRGDGTGDLMLRKPCTREEMCVMLRRFLDVL